VQRGRVHVAARLVRRGRRSPPSAGRVAGTFLLGAVAVLAAGLVPVLSAASSGAASAPTPVIIDTDLYSNADDVTALATAFALQIQGVDKVVAIGLDTKTSRASVTTSSWMCAAAVAQWYGFANTPIGSDMPDNATTPNSPDFAGACAADASPSTPSPTEAVSLYRQALAAQPDHSVVMIGIGFEENLAGLLASSPDSASALNGVDLVAQKVKALYLMGGGYPSRSGETNFSGDAGAAQQVAANWPTKVVYTGAEVGTQVYTGQTISAVHPAGSPVRAAIETFAGANNFIASYDPVNVYHAIVPGDASLSEVGPGTNVIGTYGANAFTFGSGNDYYVTVSDSEALDASIEALLDVLPPSVLQSITFTSAPPPSAVVGSTYEVAATGGASGNPVTFSIDASSSSGCTVGARGVVTFAGPAGTCVIDANQAASTDFVAAPQAQQVVTVAKAPQAITFTSSAPAPAVVGSTYKVAANGGASGNQVLFAIDGSSTSGCKVGAAGLVTFAGPAGSCVIDATQAGNASYLAAPQAQQFVTVARAAQQVAFTSAPPAAPTVGGTYQATASGGESGNAVVISVDHASTSGCVVSASGLVSFRGPAGSCVLDANQAGNASYLAAPQSQMVVTVGKAAQKVTFSSAAPPAPNVGDTYQVRAVGGGSGNPVTISIDGSSTSGCTVSVDGLVSFSGPAGTCVIDANQSGNASYLAAPQAQQSIGVGKSSQAITISSIVPSAPTVGSTYQVLATGGASGNLVTFSIDATSTSGCRTSPEGLVTFYGPAGTCVIDANQAGNAGYLDAPQVQQAVVVHRAAQVLRFTSKRPTRPRAGGRYSVSATSSSGLRVVISIGRASRLVCVKAAGNVRFVGAGTCVINANQPGTTSYLPARQIQQRLVVAAR